jgi:uncharacterized protein involved in outer membrane biogenesis
MHRTLKLLALGALGLAGALALGIVLVANANWNHAKPWLNEKLTRASMRPFAIQGSLSVDWQRSASVDAGWRGWLPWPHVTARDVVLANPSWVTGTPDMIRIEQVQFVIDPMALLHKKIMLPHLSLERPAVYLERSGNGEFNWTVPGEGQPEWAFDIRQLDIDKASMHIIDAIRHADLRISIDSGPNLAIKAGQLKWSIAGTIDREIVRGKGKAGALLTLRQANALYPIDADLHIGSTDIAVNGTLSNPFAMTGLDLRLRVSGVSMAKLFALTGIPFPETPAFATDGHLTASLNRSGSDWHYEKFSGRVGASDLSGSIDFESKKPRPLLTANLASNMLKLEDLAPLIGADSKASMAKRGAATVQPANKALPIEPFDIQRWGSIDADVKFIGHKIVRDKTLPIENIVANLHLHDSVLALQPLKFGVAGGSLVSTVMLDGRGKLIKGQIKLAARGLQIKKILPDFQSLQASLGEINGNASLSATGNSIAALLGSANGEVRTYINGGTVSKLLLEKIGLNLGSVVLTQLAGDQQVKINCMATDFSVTDGLMQTRIFEIDTEDAFLEISGRINLAQEQLALTVKPETKTVRLISFRAPFYVSGTFISPKVNVDKGVLALKTGAAVALGVLAPVLTAVVPLVNLGPDRKSRCEDLLRVVRKESVAPAAGKRYRGTLAELASAS